MALILNMVGFDSSTPINCGVSPASHSVYGLTNYIPKIWVVFESVSASLYMPKPQHPAPNTPFSFLFFLDIWLPCCACLFAVDCTSYVRCDHPPEATRRLRKLGRIAIWNRNKIVSAIAIGVWLADASFVIYGGYLPQIMGECPLNQVASQVSQR